MVIHYLKVFTFLSKEEIEKLEEIHQKNPELREAQQALAREIITDLHGSAEYEKAKKISETLFTGDVKNLDSSLIEIAFKGVPTFELREETTLIDALVNNKIASSKREGREFISNGAISINGEIVKEESYLINSNMAIDNKFIVLRRGKKKYYLIKLV